MDSTNGVTALAFGTALVTSGVHGAVLTLVLFLPLWREGSVSITNLFSFCTHLNGSQSCSHATYAPWVSCPSLSLKMLPDKYSLSVDSTLVLNVPGDVSFLYLYALLPINCSWLCDYSSITHLITLPHFLIYDLSRAFYLLSLLSLAPPHIQHSTFLFILLLSPLLLLPTSFQEATLGPLLFFKYSSTLLPQGLCTSCFSYLDHSFFFLNIFIEV